VKISIDREACVGAGQCVLAAPSVFDLDDDGKVVVLSEDPPADVHSQIRNAVFSCPAFAIEFDDGITA
jgi:ferredoxin